MTDLTPELKAQGWKFEALKALSKDLINKFENCLITNGTDPEFAAIATNKYRQALKDMEG